MAISPGGLLGRWLHQRVLTRWRDAARHAGTAELSLLRTQRQQARLLRTPLQELSHIADDRLALPRIGSSTFFRPPGTDWSWRPQAWRGGLAQRGIAPALNKSRLGDEVTVFHDSKTAGISLRQDRNRHEQDLAPYGLTLETFRFDGSFLSLVIDLPGSACTGLKKRHLIRLATLMDCEEPVSILARLNVKHGPNTEQVHLDLQQNGAEGVAEFDLAYSPINEQRVERIWLDLMIHNPGMNRIAIRDLTFCRYPRAEI